MVTNIDVTPDSSSWLRLARVAEAFLSSLTLVWLGIEGVVGVIAGVLAGSIALVAFGLDSAIEGLASVIVIWRFTGTRTMSGDAERRAQRWVAISFFLLAPYVAAEAIETLIRARQPRISLARYRSDRWHAGDLSVARAGETAHRREARIARYLW